MSKTVKNVNKCPSCKKNPAEHSAQFGLIACQSCRNNEHKISKRTYEVLPEHIKQEREEYKWQTVQPFRNGVLSKEYVQKYGTKYIEVTDEEVKNAQNVWGRSLPGDYYKDDN